MLENKFTASNGVEITYKQKKNKFDFKHLIFVFSGFLNKTPGNYDFINAMSDCPAEVIWINDSFDNMYTYYLCVNMDFKIEEAIKEFMMQKIQERNLSYSQVTTTGYSKGGSAALYYGLSMGIKNIVTTVPQMKIGSYVANNWKDVASHMMGKNYQNAHINYLDKSIVKLLKQEKDFNRNIYLLTSEADIQYNSEIKPYLEDFSKYDNFNLIKSFSVFVREHNQVTSHHTALLLSIYYALASEAVPRFNQGEVNFFGSQPCPKPDSNSKETFVDLRTFGLKEKTIFVEGVAIIRGTHLQEYSDVDYHLIFTEKNSKKEYIKPLAKTHKPHLTRELFDGNFVVYDKGEFTTYQYKGINISDIPKGAYQLSININTKNNSIRVPIQSMKNIKENIENIHFECSKTEATLMIK
ncbi:hypothetical protein [Haemophilus influenzae]|uniref:Ccs3 n=1 Tax=Haemophilus influenzae TaxID=727 RepID=F6KWE3_HAEIF|nr:hypothetical protein [Haemophilus influenzae]AEC50904.1 Ccs3 [Haemophilus influenzae]AEK12211.1 CcsC [Haemophilus influenzae]